MYVHFDDTMTDVTTFKTYLASNPITIYYPLASEVTEDVMLPELPTISGENQLYVDTTELPKNVVVGAAMQYFSPREMYESFPSKDDCWTKSESEKYTTFEKNKLNEIEIGAEVNVQSDWTQTDSSSDDFIKNKPTNLSQFTNDYEFITNDTSSLTNYYKKSDTLSTVEINGILEDKVDKITGKRLSTNDFTNELLNKLNAVDETAEPMNIMGQICLPFTLIWIVLSAAIIVVDDWVRYKIFKEEKPHYTSLILNKLRGDKNDKEN